MTDTGNINLDRQITSTITIMALSENASDFDKNFQKVHARQLPLKTPPLKLKPEKAPVSLPLFPMIDDGHVA